MKNYVFLTVSIFDDVFSDVNLFLNNYLTIEHSFLFYSIENDQSLINMALFIIKYKNLKDTFHNYFMRILLNRQRDERNFVTY